MRARGALAVAALLLLTACSSAPPAPTGSGSASAEPDRSASVSGEGETVAPRPADSGPLDVEPLGDFEPAEPSASIPCLDDGFEHLAVAGEPRAWALVAGDGPVGVVLGHQSDAYPCQWAAEASRLAALGYTAIIPNLQLREPVAAVLAAERLLRASGADDVVLAGASLGGVVAIAAAAIVDEPPAGVIALAPPVAYRGIDAHDYAPLVAAPVLIAVGTGDVDLPEQADEIAALLPSPPRVITVDTAEHGVPLLEHAPAREAVDAFLAEVAPPG